MMIINNYTKNYGLNENIKKIYELVISEPKYWDKDITIQIRYVDEILSNRAGAAPNKIEPPRWADSATCVMPFLDFVSYTNGTVGLCCNDALEKTNLGNVIDSSIYDIWTSRKYQEVRELIGRSRSRYAFCKGCDIVDAGLRNKVMKEILHSL